MSSTTSNVVRNFRSVLDRIQMVYTSAPESGRARSLPRLVAVSKTKPQEMIQALYEEGHRHFGENYVQELIEKANDSFMLEKCPEIKWHFIGNLQTNKVHKIIKIPHLTVIETVTSSKLADKLNHLWGEQDRKLQVMIQVNTSGEENKNGVEPDQLKVLVQHLVDNCGNLEFVGLMTIGDLGHSLASTQRIAEEGGPNPDFISLIKCRRDVAAMLNVDEHSLELSMGMSNDFEEAIRMGSTNIRIGSTIFGEREYRPKTPTKIIEDKMADTKL